MPKENPARFILAEWKNRREYKRWFQNDRNPMGVSCHRVDLASFLEGLDFGELGVHDVRLEFGAGSVEWACGANGWCWDRRNHVWKRRFDLGVGVCVLVFRTGTVQVLVKCSSRPFEFGLDGLFSIASVLGEVRARLGGSCVGIPPVSEWVVVQWHRGRDAKCDVSGLSFHVTFPTWAGELARVYVKNDLKAVRLERIESPRVSMKTLAARFLPSMRRGDVSYIE